MYIYIYIKGRFFSQRHYKVGPKTSSNGVMGPLFLVGWQNSRKTHLLCHVSMALTDSSAWLSRFLRPRHCLSLSIRCLRTTVKPGLPQAIVFNQEILPGTHQICQKRSKVHLPCPWLAGKSPCPFLELSLRESSTSHQSGSEMRFLPPPLRP